MGWELLIFFINPVVNALWDAKHGELHHLRSWFIKGTVLVVQSIAISYIFPNPWPELITSAWWLYLMIGIAIEWAFFDYLYNAFTGQDWYYIGESKWHKDDWTYKIYKYLGPSIIVFIKIFILVTALSLYFQLDRLS